MSVHSLPQDFAHDRSVEEVKRAYRKLDSQNHADKLASRGLPERMHAVAEERSQAFNSTCDPISSARDDVK